MILKGKRAVVTGSTSGIGQGIITKLASEGCDVVVHGFGDEKEIQSFCQSLSAEFGIKSHYLNTDIATAKGCEDLIHASAQLLNGLDILVNNAGIQYTSPIETFPPEKWDAIIAVNLSAVFHTTRVALPFMRKGEFGRIINIASAHGHVASEQKAAYVAAKHAVVGLTKVTALETAQENITCNAICPGWVLTPLVQQQIDARAKNQNISIEEASAQLLFEKQPSMAFVTPQQLGALAVFLCQEEASQITGSSQLIDGGWTAR